MSRRALALAAALLLVLAAGCGPAGEGGDDAAPELGPPAPEFALRDLEGGEVRLADLRGRIVVLDFWATWCPPCEFQIPILNSFWEAYRDRGVEVIGISVDTAPVEDVKAYVEKHGARYPIVMGSESLARQFGAQGFPTLFVVDAGGRIAQTHIGLVEEPDLVQAVTEVAGGVLPGAAEASEAGAAPGAEPAPAAPPAGPAPDAAADADPA